MQIKVELLESFCSDEGVAHAAWASSGKDKNRTEKDVHELLYKIIRDGHDSCLEHVVFRFRIEAPMYIMQQITRHRIASFNAASGRYQFPFTEFFRIPDDVFMQLNTIDFEEYNQICFQALAYYKRVCEKHKGNKRVLEVLRGALPTATMSSLVVTINLRSWLNFYRQRSDSHAQKEIQEIAEQTKALILKLDSIKQIMFNLEMRGRL